MDLHTVTSVVTPRHRDDLAGWQPGDAYLAGGSWLFSEPQHDTRRLVDLTMMGWPALEITPEGLLIGATCTLAALMAAELPAHWAGSVLIRQCGEALLGSFKVANVATVGGNVCLALPAGPMTSLTAALDGVCTLWSADGSQRVLAVVDLVTAPGRTALRPGELLRSVQLPLAALTDRTAFRRHSLSTMGRSGVVVIGRAGAAGAVFTVTASTPRPVQLRFPDLPSTTDLLAALDASGVTWFDDVHGLPLWRRDLTRAALADVRNELAAP